MGGTSAFAGGKDHIPKPDADKHGTTDANGNRVSYIAGERVVPNQDTNGTYYPTENPHVTEPYGYRTHPKKKTKELHSATDYRNSMNANVYAVKSGEITKVGQTSSGTNYVEITDKNSHKHGYYHTTTNLGPGTKVNAGLPFGNTDVSGYSTGPHLHYTVQTGPNRSDRVDPEVYLELNNAKPVMKSLLDKKLKRMSN